MCSECFLYVQCVFDICTLGVCSVCNGCLLCALQQYLYYGIFAIISFTPSLILIASS